ncbi:MAG: GxxExxY protein [Lentisphaerales bacterium]|jgi:GxxExxY protein|nr:MAG: GxxExxY protein [Lentisphaerales bacterium]
MNDRDEDIKKLCDTVRETSFAVHRFLRSGHVEKVYENAMVNRLRKAGIDVQKQYPLNVYDEDGTLLGEFYADLFVQEKLVVELKACSQLADEHVAQLLGYLRSSRCEHGMLINFGGRRLQVKKYILTEEAY